MHGPSLGEVLFADSKVGGTHSGRNRVSSWITKIFHNITNTHPSTINRVKFLGQAYDVERVFVPREHGIVTGLTIASIWFTFLSIGYALNYRDLRSLDLILFWICLILLFGLIVIPLRHMQGRFVSTSKIFRHIWQSYAWSTVTSTLALQTITIIPMIIMGKLNIFSMFLSQMLLAHFAAVSVSMIMIPRFKELGLIRASQKDDSENRTES